MTDHPDIEALEDLLCRESAALLDGDLDAVTRLAARKDRLMNRIPALAPDAETLARLRHALTRNCLLLAAAASGVRAAKDRLRALTEGPPPLSTYDARGQVQRIRAGDRGEVRRA